MNPPLRLLSPSSKIDTLVRQELVVEVVFDFGHVGDNVCLFDKTFREVTTG
jgi:hypothetical protein